MARRHPLGEPASRDEQDRESRPLTRRGVVAGSVRLVAAAAGLATAACSTLGLPKRSKADAQYQDRPRMGQQCSGCMHFEAPNRCSVVEGDISPHGWSKFYLAKPA